MKRVYDNVASLLIAILLFVSLTSALHHHALAKPSESCHVCQTTQTYKSAAPQARHIAFMPFTRFYFLLADLCDDTVQSARKVFRNRSPPALV